MANISIIVPVYKVEKYIEICYNSILSQHYKDIEIILVDDGSPDNSGKMCDEFAAQMKDIPVYVIHQMNGGLSAARNSGIDWAMACSDSEWLCFVDSDDTISESFIEKLHDAAVANDADLAVCDFMEVDTDGNDIHKPDDFPSGLMSDNDALFETMYQTWRVHPAWNKLYKKKLFQDLRFDNGKLHEDEFIIHKVLFLSDKVVFMPDLLYYYLIRQSGIMGTENRKTKADAFYATIERYWFCKKNNLPRDFRSLGIDYMTLVTEFGDKEVTKKYKEIFFDYEPNRSIMRHVRFQLFPIYNRYRKRRLG